MPSLALIVLMKNPIMGKVKTRIAKGSNDETALSIYKQLLSRCSEVTRSLNEDIDILLYYSYFIDEDDDWIHVHQKKLQQGDELGERLINAFTQTFSNGYDKAVVIGTDCYDLSMENVHKAFASLSNSDMVIGPSYDGGYYLLGMKKFYPSLFQDIMWSTDSVFPQTLKKAQLLGLEISTLEKLHDIDHYEDWLAMSQR